MWGHHQRTLSHTLQVSGIVQTALYIDFFYTYINAKKKRIDAPIELECDV